MSVLIKGMEKPKRCVDCPLNFAGLCSVRLQNGKCPLDGIPEWCPMTDVPEPHGKLIDAEDLIKILDISIEIDGRENAERVTKAFNDILDTIRGVSAVIEEEL